MSWWKGTHDTTRESSVIDSQPCRARTCALSAGHGIWTPRGVPVDPELNWTSPTSGGSGAPSAMGPSSAASVRTRQPGGSRPSRSGACSLVTSRAAGRSARATSRRRASSSAGPPGATMEGVAPACMTP
nr:hypothetical protein [Actinomadura madurae]